MPEGVTALYSRFWRTSVQTMIPPPGMLVKVYPFGGGKNVWMPEMSQGAARRSGMVLLVRRKASGDQTGKGPLKW